MRAKKGFPPATNMVLSESIVETISTAAEMPVISVIQPGQFDDACLFFFVGAVRETSSELYYLTLSNNKHLHVALIVRLPSLELSLNMVLTAYGYLGKSNYGCAALLCTHLVDSFPATPAGEHIRCVPEL